MRPARDVDEMNIPGAYHSLMQVKIGRKVAEAMEKKGCPLNEEEIEAIAREEGEKIVRWRKRQEDKLKLGKIPSNQLDEINTRIYRDMLLAKVRRRVAEAKEKKGHALNEEEIQAITREEWEKMMQWRKLLPKSSYRTGLCESKKSSIFNWRPPPGF